MPARSDGAPTLIWYVRRRAVAYRPNVTGIAVAISGDDAALTKQLGDRLVALGLQSRVDAIRAAATPFATARMTAFLGSPRIVSSDLLLIAGTRELERALPPATPPPQADGPTGRNHAQPRRRRARAPRCRRGSPRSRAVVPLLARAWSDWRHRG